ncbi:hypothetical protein CJF32_00009546 [Rutstroemia sp. NJR-2017a WRK4]|nr:hypothetical protein CJF32_00009546 [Rutstroemia sp. NJR-2017a WRK4]
MTSISPKYPFEKGHELFDRFRNPNQAQQLPGYPQISLQDTTELVTFISKDLRIPILEKIGYRYNQVHTLGLYIINSSNYAILSFRRILNFIWFDIIIGYLSSLYLNIYYCLTSGTFILYRQLRYWAWRERSSDARHSDFYGHIDILYVTNPIFVLL